VPGVRLRAQLVAANWPKNAASNSFTDLLSRV